MENQNIEDVSKELTEYKEENAAKEKANDEDISEAISRIKQMASDNKSSKKSNQDIEPYESKKANRFILKFPEELELNSWFVIATSRPTVVIHNGVTEYDTININFRDPISPSVARALWDMYIGFSKEVFDETTIHPKVYETIKTKLAKFDGKFDYELEMLDPTGVPIERWTIQGCEIISISFGNLNYESDGIANCALKIKPTRAILLY